MLGTQLISETVRLSAAWNFLKIYTHPWQQNMIESFMFSPAHLIIIFIWQNCKDVPLLSHLSLAAFFTFFTRPFLSFSHSLPNTDHQAEHKNHHYYLIDEYWCTFESTVRLHSGGVKAKCLFRIDERNKIE